MNFCKYKNILGFPKKGVHSRRIYGFALFDISMTIIAAMLISYFYGFSFIYTALALFILGILLHRLFCVRTTGDKLLFPHVTDYTD